MTRAGADLRADAADLLGDDVAAVPVGGDAGGAGGGSSRAPRWPYSECLTSGCHCTPYSLRSSLANAATGVEAGRREHVEALRRLRDGVAVAHPRGLLVGLARRAGSRRRRVTRHVGRAVLAQRRCARPRRRALSPSPGSRSRCRATGTPSSRISAVELRGALLVDARRAARRARCRTGRFAATSAAVIGVRHDLGVDARLAHAAGDQLGVLRAEVDDEHRDRSGWRCRHR